ncbi:MAG: dihydropteroate synthase [Bacteroidota bacterium]|jgi:dihydropteroate synthase
MFTLNCKGRLLCAETPIVMGILNITPDSFYEGSRFENSSTMIHKAGEMIQEGATILDIGGQSSRPGAEPITAEEEWKRIAPAIQSIRENFPEIFISVDTYYASVAQSAVEAGADIINDISAGKLDPEMIPTVAHLNIPFIAMHMKGNPSNMQEQTTYKDLLGDIIDYFTERIQYLHKAGIKDVIIDPGFGFAKTIEQNFKLLSNLEDLQILQMPILAGLSRKSMIYKTLGISPGESLNGSSVLHTIALTKGAQILRTHDVKEAVECIKLTEKLRTKPA